MHASSVAIGDRYLLTDYGTRAGNGRFYLHDRRTERGLYISLEEYQFIRNAENLEDAIASCDETFEENEDMLRAS